MIYFNTDNNNSETYYEQLYELLADIFISQEEESEE